MPFIVYVITMDKYKCFQIGKTRINVCGKVSTVPMATGGVRNQ